MYEGSPQRSKTLSLTYWQNSRLSSGYRRFRPFHKGFEWWHTYWTLVLKHFETISPGGHESNFIIQITCEKTGGSPEDQETALRPVHGWSPRTGWCKWPNCPDAASCRSLQRMVSASLHPATTRRGSSPLKPDTPTWRYKKNPENRLVSLKSFEAYLVVVGFDFLHSTCEARAAWFSSGDQRNAPTWDVGSAVPWPWKPLAMENRRVFLPVGEFCSKTFEESLTRAFLGSLWGAS